MELCSEFVSRKRKQGCDGWEVSVSESAPRVLPASLYRPGEREREGFCGGRGYDQVSKGTNSL